MQGKIGIGVFLTVIPKHPVWRIVKYNPEELYAKTAF